MSCTIFTAQIPPRKKVLINIMQNYFSVKIYVETLYYITVKTKFARGGVRLTNLPRLAGLGFGGIKQVVKAKHI